MSNSMTRLNPDAVKALIKSTTYHRSPSGKAIICEIMLHSGRSCIGIARVIDMENDDEVRGKEAALAHATTEVWDYAAVMMQHRMHTGEVANNNAEILVMYTSKFGGSPVLI